MPKKKTFFPGLFLFLLLSTIIFSTPANREVKNVDGIVAIVNDDIITLTDLRIVQAFGLLGREMDIGVVYDHNEILESMIEQKLAVQMTGEADIIGADELNIALQRELDKLNKELLRNELEQFDIKIDDLKEYLIEMILYQRVISRRFSREIFVNLKELEVYYEERYLTAQKEKNQKPQPMMKILNEIESIVKEEKAEKQIEEWLKYLIDKADIQVFTDKYPEYFTRRIKG
jgi:parvulin-like peptidyl-prolyl isomerase